MRTISTSSYCPHISPIGWDNVLLYGEYQLNRGLVQSERLSV